MNKRHIWILLTLIAIYFLFSNLALYNELGLFARDSISTKEKRIEIELKRAQLELENARLNLPEEAPVVEQQAIQVALLLDVSGSMDGLIEQAKSQLWDILNELAKTEKRGAETELQIALYSYGNNFSGKNGYYLKQLSGFTTDMDMISEQLFALSTTGSSEYCGAVIQASLDDLVWTNDDGLKMIYIAGNEPFTQGPVSFAEACRRAKKEEIFVNTIFCGDQLEGIEGQWKAGAIAGGGDYFNINHNEATAYIETPYDEELGKLNGLLNETYLPFGQLGHQKCQNQLAQDANAQQYGTSNTADRIAFKSSKKYKADDWDLVDAYKKDKNVIKGAEVVDESLKGLSEQELEAKVKEQAEKREKIQKEIQTLDKKRQAYKVEHLKKNPAKSLQQSMKECVRKQAAAKGFSETSN